MGNEESTSSDGLRGSPQRSPALEVRDLRSVAKYIKSEDCQNIFVMVRSVSLASVHDAQSSAGPYKTHRVILPCWYCDII